jgi:hypothetical protein
MIDIDPDAETRCREWGGIEGRPTTYRCGHVAGHGGDHRSASGIEWSSPSATKANTVKCIQVIDHGINPDAETRLSGARVPMWLAERARNACWAHQMSLNGFMVEAIKVHLATIEACRNGERAGKAYPARPLALLTRAQIARQL